MIIDNTPLETYAVDGIPVIVKREDLCCPFPGPSFSKIRGVVAHIKNRPEHVIGVLDTLHSKAGWAVSYVCQQLGKQAVDFWPRYKRDPAEGLPRFQQQHAASLGAHMRDLQAGRSAVLYHGAKKQLAGEFRDSYMMPNALKLPESVTENAAEAERTARHMPWRGNLVISISSGTVAAGVLLGLFEAGILPRYNVVLHMGYSRSQKQVLDYIQQVSGLPDLMMNRIRLVDEGYSYGDKAPRSDVPAPFPCNPYYDLKAWRWLENPNLSLLHKTSEPVVFWNIGE